MSYRLLRTLLLLLQLQICSAFVPPKPGSDLEATYEPVRAYRRRRNITFAYQPTSLHPETCRYLSEAQCQDADESMQRHQQRHRSLQKKLYEGRRRRLQTTTSNIRGGGAQNSTDAEDEDLEYHMAEFRRLLGEATEHFDKDLQQQPTSQEEKEELDRLLEWDQQQSHRRLPNPRLGQFRVLVLLLKFTDHGSRSVPNRYEYQILWNLRIRKWLIQNSYGKYDAFFEVRPWRQSDNTEAHYSFGQSGRVGEFQESYWPLLDALDNDPDWDWSKYDIDGDGKLDNIVVLHSGYAAEEGGQDCTNGREYLDRIWSHAFSDSNGWKNADNSMQVEGYTIASALDLTCESLPAKMGVMTHEYLHTFYLIDLYDYTFEGKGVGTFDIMAYPYGFSNDGYIPVGLSAWAKTAIDWLNCPTQTSSGTVTLEPIVSSEKGCLKIVLQGEEGSEEYLLLENRQQLGFDVDFWQDGVVIYHIDETANEQYDRGYPGQSGWPNNGNHYGIAVLQADGAYDLEQGVNNGDSEDMWVAGMSIGPNSDGNTYPNTDMYQGGNIQRSGITIDIQEQIGNNFKIKITMSKRSANDIIDNSDSVFSAPSKESQSTTTTTALAQEQFHTPDAQELRISGKIPQLPWYDEQVAASATQAQDPYSIQVLDTKVESSASGRRSGCWMWVGTVVAAIVGAVVV